VSEPRGLAFDANGYFYLAHKQLGIVVFDHDDSYAMVGVMEEYKSCIGVTYDPVTNTIFTGSSKTHTVYQFEAFPSLKLVKTFSAKHSLKHPAGIAVYDDKLYVASQGTNSIVTFDVNYEVMLHDFMTTEADSIEDLILSPC
jgi:DNA-binding beta-propeller fold protein YncE